MNLIESISKHFKDHPILTLLAGVGVLVTGSTALSAVQTTWKYCIRPHSNLWKRYGSKDAWAIITGASEPLGMGYARVLVRAGFNVLLIGRKSELPLIEVAALQNLNKGVQIQYLAFNFAESALDQFYNGIKETVGGREIAILVNAEEEIYAAPLDKFPEHKIEAAIHANIHAMTYMVRIVLPSMYMRKTKSAIISVTSSLIHKPIPYCGVLLGGKAYVKALMNCLALEARDKNVDFLTCLTGPISTINSHGWAVNYEQVAKGQLGFAGKENKTYGCFRHWLYAHLPWSNRYSYKTGEKMMLAHSNVL